MKKVAIYFPENKSYNKITFLGGKAYELVDTPDGFVGRWLKRGCTPVSGEAEVLADPRFPIEKIKKVIKETVKAVEEKIVEVVKPKKVIKKKPSKKVEAKDVAVQEQEL